MRTAVSIACGAVFFVIGILFLLPSPNNIFFWFIASLANYFLIAHIFYSLLCFVAVRSYLLCLNEGSQIDDVQSYVSTDSERKELTMTITGGFAFFLAVSTIPGFKMSWDLALGCHNLGDMCRYMSHRQGFFSAMAYGLGGLVSLFYMVAFPFVMAAVGAVVGATLPTFVAGVISFSHRHPAEGFMSRSLQQFRSDPRAERELLRIMNEQDASDEEVERLMGRLAPWERWYKRIEYRKRARDIRRLREMAELKRRALEEETRFAQSVHGLEGARRRADDRR